MSEPESISAGQVISATPPLEGFTVVPSKMSLTITFGGIGQLDPLDDITAKEAVHISMLITAASQPYPQSRFLDIEGFIAKHNLSRHFRKT
jgi:hypothetical protein